VQYHEVKVNLEFRESKECYWSSAPVLVGDLAECSLFVDYIYLDTDERRRFAQVSHEYLIEQLQYTGEETVPSGSKLPKLKLNFNHPIKSLIWVVQREEHLDLTDSDVATYKGIQPFNYTDAWDNSLATNLITGEVGDPVGDDVGGVAAGGFGGVQLPVIFGGKNPVVKAKLQLNGHDRFSERDGRYFNLVQPYQHHENVPKAGINVYSFALKPEEHQPSGTCNMSRIDNATLQLQLTDNTGACRVRIYAVNYNVLRIMSKLPIRTEKYYARLIMHTTRKIIQWCINIIPQVLVRNTFACNKTKLRETPKAHVTSQPRRTLVMVKNMMINGQPAANRRKCRQVQRLYGFGRLETRLRYSPAPLQMYRKIGYKREWVAYLLGPKSHGPKRPWLV
jgi:hypothetical protein